jgi:hypothetical protein
MDQLTTVEVHGHEIVRGLGPGTIARRVILDAQLCRCDHDAQVTVVLIVVVLEHDQIGVALRRLDEICGARIDGLPFLISGMTLWPPAVTTNDVRDLCVVARSSTYLRKSAVRMLRLNLTNGGFGPVKRHGVLIVAVDEIINGLAQLLGRGEAGAAERGAH